MCSIFMSYLLLAQVGRMTAVETTVIQGPGKANRYVFIISNTNLNFEMSSFVPSNSTLLLI